ncbi:MAG: nucleoside-diphosphate sugar epimerase/dehydratase [Actinomycetota bacterium]|nr:nucleoside-diphosphate sugar epimerase/dehydratase [Actinomycetota bacterium]
MRRSSDLPTFDDWTRTLILAASDGLCWPLALAFTAAVEEWPLTSSRVLLIAVVGMLGQVLVGFATGLYRRRFQPFSFEEIGVAGLTVGLAGVIALVADRFAAGEPFGHRCVWATATAGSLVLTLRYVRRLRARVVRNRRARPRTPVVVLGAGEGGMRAVRAMLSSPVSGYRPVALLDDDPAKRSLRIMGVRVLGRFDELPRVAHHMHAQAAVLAIPSADAELLSRLHLLAQRAGLQTLVLPPVQQLVGSGSTAELRTYNDEDVLRRRMVSIDMAAVHALIAGRRVLVTGAGGSIGSELSAQISRFEPQSLALLDHDDSLLHAVHSSVAGFPDVFPVLADIRDEARVNEVFATYQPEVVFHAAALKHVPALEAAPAEGWKTNVLGTRNVLAAAEANGVEQFVNISTDKAADPLSVLGRTKRIAEQMTAAVAQRTGRRYVSVRFGNVIGSRGSVMETFQAQIEAGGPVTVTDPEVTRFFMAVREAVRLTLQAATMGSAGEVLVLDMGAPVRIADIARQLIEQSGKRVEIRFIGLRPGEKLHEVLLSNGEEATRPHHPLIDHVHVPAIWPDLPADYEASVLHSLAAAESVGYAAPHTSG